MKTANWCRAKTTTMEIDQRISQKGKVPFIVAIAGATSESMTGRHEQIAKGALPGTSSKWPMRENRRAYLINSPGRGIRATRTCTTLPNSIGEISHCSGCPSTAAPRRLPVNYLCRGHPPGARNDCQDADDALSSPTSIYMRWTPTCCRDGTCYFQPGQDTPFHGLHPQRRSQPGGAGVFGHQLRCYDPARAEVIREQTRGCQGWEEGA